MRISQPFPAFKSISANIKLPIMWHMKHLLTGISLILLNLYASSSSRAEDVNILCTPQKPGDSFVVFIPSSSTTAMIKYGSGGQPFPTIMIASPSQIELRRAITPGLSTLYIIDRTTGEFKLYTDSPSLQRKKLMDTGSCSKQPLPESRMF